MMFTAQEISEATGFPTYEQLKECCEANAEGRLLILPKTLYEADPTPLIKGVTEWKVTGVRYYDGAVQEYTVQTENVQTIIYGREIGKTVFLTRADAEAALRKENDT